MLLKYLKSPTFIIIVFLVFLESFVTVLPQQVFGILIDNLTGKSRTSNYLIENSLSFLHNLSSLSIVNFLVIAYLIVSLGVFIVSLIRGYLVTLYGYKVKADVRKTLYSKLLRVKPKYLKEMTSGEASTLIISDVEAIRDIIISPINGIVVDLITAIIMAFVCFNLSKSLTLIMLIPVPLVIFNGYFFGKKQYALSNLEREQMSKIKSTIISRFKDYKLFKLFIKENEEDSLFNNLITEYVQTGKKGLNLHLLIFPFTSGARIIINVIIIVVGINLVKNNELSVGGLIVFIQYLGRFYLPFMNITRYYNSIISSFVSYRKITQVITDCENKAEIVDIVEGNIFTRFSNPIIQFKNISFKHDTAHNNYIIDNLSFDINIGDKVAFVGASGSGKTTLLNLLTKLEDNYQGSLLLNNYEIKSIPAQLLRKKIGYLTQESYMYDLPLIENIRYGNPKATDSEVINVLEKVKLEYLNTNEELYSLRGNYGEKLSGGEKQRIAIARLFLCNPEIILLDEPVANLDIENANNILSLLFDLFKSKTIIITSHQDIISGYINREIKVG